MLENTAIIPWILAALGAAILVLIAYIIYKCIKGMRKFRDDERQPVITEKAVVIEKVHTIKTGRKLSVDSIESVHDESIAVILKINGNLRTFDVGQILYENLKEDMSGLAQIKADRLVGFITDDGEAFGDEYDEIESKC